MVPYFGWVLVGVHSLLWGWRGRVVLNLREGMSWYHTYVGFLWVCTPCSGVGEGELYGSDLGLCDSWPLYLCGAPAERGYVMVPYLGWVLAC